MRPARHESLTTTRFIDFDHPRVRAFVEAAVGATSDPVEQAKALFKAVRDKVRYDPYAINFDPKTYVASEILTAPGAFCIPKAVLFCACLRAVGIKAMLGFADVKNHLNTRKLSELLGTDLFVYHGYCALELNGKWCKATPSFNIELCQRFGVDPLDFDGENDALLHAYDGEGRRHMEYVNDHGLFADLPFELLEAEFNAHYPKLMARQGQLGDSRFEDEKPLA